MKDSVTRRQKELTEHLRILKNKTSNHRGERLFDEDIARSIENVVLDEILLTKNAIFNVFENNDGKTIKNTEIKLIEFLSGVFDKIDNKRYLNYSYFINKELWN